MVATCMYVQFLIHRMVVVQIPYPCGWSVCWVICDVLLHSLHASDATSSVLVFFNWCQDSGFRSLIYRSLVANSEFPLSVNCY